MRRSAEDLAQEPHWRRCVGQRGEAHPVDRGDEETTRDADAFPGVVVLLRAPIGKRAMNLLEQHHDPGDDVEEVLVPVRPDRFEGGQPLLGHASALVTLSLLGLGREADPVLDRWIGDRHEGPRLLVGT